MTDTEKKPRIAIAGAGSIGCFVGALLSDSGADVRFLARPRIAAMLLEHGLRATDLGGLDVHIPANDLKIATDPAILSKADIILVTVKSSATEEIANTIATHAPKNAVIVSLQNGVTNADVIRNVLPDRDVRAGMVAYNVLNAGDGRFHRGVSGNIVIEGGPANLAAQLSTPDLAVHESSDMPAVQWGKLLINLNNALNALSGLPLREEIFDRGWRSLLADQIAEALPALAAENIKPRSATPLPTKLLPSIMRLPTPIYKIIAAKNMRIDPEARSSMWEDLEAGRATEIDELQGAVIALCAKHGLQAPINKRIFDLIKQVEASGGGSPKLTPAQVRGDTPLDNQTEKKD